MKIGCQHNDGISQYVRSIGTGKEPQTVQPSNSKILEVEKKILVIFAVED